jgi:hypothetical protein
VPLPPEVVAASLAAFDLHDPSVPVVRLAADSLDDAGADPPDGADRQLVFDSGGVHAEVSVRKRPSGSEVRVDVSRQGFDDLVLVQPKAQVVVDLREGAAVLTDVPSGPTSLLLRRGAGNGGAARTAWIIL